MATIHHLGFLVRDLESAVARYTKLLGEPPTAEQGLENRGVKTARFALGSIWLVLIQPVDPAGIPGQYLEQHGEGFFMLSLASSCLEKTSQELLERDMALDWSTLRAGLDNWRVIDLKQWEPFDVVIQFAEDVERS